MEMIIMNVIEKFCSDWNRPMDLTGNSVAFALTSALVEAIEEDLTTADFTSEEIKELSPSVIDPPGIGRVSEVSPLWKPIRQAVIDFDLFKRADQTLEWSEWDESMETDRNLVGESFSERVKGLFHELVRVLEIKGSLLPYSAEHDLASLKSIESIWEDAKKSPRYYICCREAYYIYEVSEFGRNVYYYDSSKY